jgi:hypothetical protein
VEDGRRSTWRGTNSQEEVLKRCSRSTPSYVLADILGRLAPRWLAASRSVRKAWRAVIDHRRLLDDADILLLLSLSGIFFNSLNAEVPPYLSRPPPHEPVDARFNFLCAADGHIYFEIADHCNGLLLIESGGHHVVNPATRRSVRLPYPKLMPPTTPRNISYLGYSKTYIAFDPATSPHYEVFEIRDGCARRRRGAEEAECPRRRMICASSPPARGSGR